mgnify:CR=1 FL=1
MVYIRLKMCQQCNQLLDTKQFKKGCGTYTRVDVCNNCSPPNKKYRYGSTLVVKKGEKREVITSTNFIPNNSYYNKLADQAITEETVIVKFKE